MDGSVQSNGLCLVLFDSRLAPGGPVRVVMSNQPILGLSRPLVPSTFAHHYTAFNDVVRQSHHVPEVAHLRDLT